MHCAQSPSLWTLTVWSPAVLRSKGRGGVGGGSGDLLELWREKGGRSGWRVITATGLQSKATPIPPFPPSPSGPCQTSSLPDPPPPTPLSPSRHQYPCGMALPPATSIPQTCITYCCMMVTVLKNCYVMSVYNTMRRCEMGKIERSLWPIPVSLCCDVMERLQNAERRYVSVTPSWHHCLIHHNKRTCLLLLPLPCIFVLSECPFTLTPLSL